MSRLAVLTAVLVATPAWAIDPPALADVTIDAGGGTTLVSAVPAFPWWCDTAQDFLVPPNNERGVWFSWDLDNNGSYETITGNTPQVAFSTATIDGPADRTVKVQAGCWYWDLLGNRWIFDVEDDDARLTIRNAAPVVSAATAQGYAADGLVMNTPITFAATVSDPEPADTVTVRWSWSDGVVSTGNPTSRSFPAGGPISATVAATDDDGGVGQLVVPFKVVNDPPTIVRLSAPSQVDEGEVSWLEAEATDPTDPLTYRWAITDGTSLTGQRVQWTALADGAHTITLTVSDGITEVTADAHVDVDNLPPVVRAITQPATVIEGMWTTLVADAVDPGRDPLRSKWDFGSGFGAWTAVGTLSAAWQFPDDGGYDVVAVVEDDAGAQGSRQVRVQVRNADPVIRAIDVPATASEGEEVVLSITAEDVPADPLSCTWILGDGAELEGCTVAHTFAQGLWSVQVEVDDGDGGVVGADGFVQVNNAAPVGLVDVPADIDEGEEVELTIDVGDPGGDPVEVTWFLGDGARVDGPVARHAWADDGTYAATVLLDDGEGGVTTIPFDVIVRNVAPTIVDVEVPPLREGQQGTLTATTDDPGADPVTITWKEGARVLSVGPVWSPVFPDDVDTVVTVVADDGDGGVTTRQVPVVVENVPPTVRLTGDTSDAADPELTWTALATDPGQDTFTYDWDFGDGEVLVNGGMNAGHTYAMGGRYQVVVTVTDDDGGVGTALLDVTIRGDGPAILLFELPSAIDEGSEAELRCEGSDPATGQPVSVGWTFGDGGSASGSPVRHTWVDDGRYDVTCVVTDAAGATAEASRELTVRNVAPTITGAPAVTVEEGTTYVFQAGVVDPGVADAALWSLTGPAGAAVSATGRVTWTAPQGAGVERPFQLSVLDDDGGQDVLAWTVEVVPLDEDDDGLSDWWETSYGLDPTDPTDAREDIDGDGRTALEEQAAGSSPLVDDRPRVPVLVAPIRGASVADATPALSWRRSMGATRYEVVVYPDDNLVIPVAAWADLDGPGDVLTVEAPELVENARYVWTARAGDDYAFSDWADFEPFTINAVAEPPPPPPLRWPSDGATVATVSPELRWGTVLDPDGDAVVYDLTLAIPGGGVVSEVTGLSGIGAELTWAVTPPLADGQGLCWLVTARDATGLTSARRTPWCFTVDLSNLPPSDPVILAPGDGETVPSRTVDIEILPGVDPEGEPVSLRVQLDVAPTWDSPDLQEATLLPEGGEPVVWTVEELPEDSWWHLRVIASDGGAESGWVTSTFFVSAVDAPPDAPLLLSPDDGFVVAAGVDAVGLVASEVTDPEGTDVTYTFAVHDGAGEWVAGAEGVYGDGDGTARWTAVGLRAGQYTWTARAVDGTGQASAWADARALVVEASDSSSRVPRAPPLDDYFASLGGTGCGCGTVDGSPWAAVGVALVALRRRRRAR